MATMTATFQRIIQATNRRFDRLVRPVLRVGGASRPAFQVFGAAGWLGAIGFALLLTLALGRSVWITLGMSLTAFGAFLALAILTKLVTGDENLTYFRHTLLVLLSVTGFLALIGAPPLPYLDVVALGLAVATGIGRFACLFAGCCHGRVCGWGARYGKVYAGHGFPRHFVGARLLPVPLLEAGWAWLIVLSGLALLASGQAAGAALAWYLALYALGRFTLEFWRGDAARRYWRGFSEAQWTALLVLAGVNGAAWAGVLPGAWWQVAALLAVALTMPGLTLWRRRDPLQRHTLLRAAHVAEIARALRVVSVEVRARTTAQGLSLSTSRPPDAEGWHVALSRQPEPLTAQQAALLADLIRDLKAPDAVCRIVPGSAGVFHVLFSDPVPARADAVFSSGVAKGHAISHVS